MPAGDKKALLSDFFCIFALLSSAQAQENPIITVLDFSVDGVSDAEMQSIINVLSSSLFKSGRFTVIDVGQRETILKEMEFSMSGCTDESCMLEIGKMLSAEGIVVGSIGRVGSRYILSAKLLQTETGAALSTADGMYADLDKLMDGLVVLARELALPFDEEAAVIVEPPEEESREGATSTFSVFPWVSAAGAAGCLAAGSYMLAVALPIFLDYTAALKAYMDATDQSVAEELYIAAEEARLEAVDAGVNGKLTAGGVLVITGVGLGIYSVLQFFPGDNKQGTAADVAVVAGGDGVMLGFRLRY